MCLQLHLRVSKNLLVEHTESGHPGVCNDETFFYSYVYFLVVSEFMIAVLIFGSLILLKKNVVVYSMSFPAIIILWVQYSNVIRQVATMYNCKNSLQSM